VKAAVYHGRRDVRVEEVAEPAAPGPGDLLLDVRLAAICGTDVGEYLHGPRVIPITFRHAASGHEGPMVIGHEFLGSVAAVGDGVEGFAVGDRIVSGAGVSCGRCEWCRAGRTNLCADYYTLGLHTDGGLAEQVIVPASTGVAVADSCSDRAAVLAQPLSIALHSVSRAGVRPGDTVVVIGVGGIGSFIVAAAASVGAGAIVAVDIDDDRLATARELGATQTLLAGSGEIAGPDGAPIVIEATGTQAGLDTALRTVRRGGTVLLVGMHHEQRPVDLMDLTIREVTLTTTQAHICATDLPRALELLARSDLDEHVVDRVIPLASLVEDGLLAMAGHRVHGKVVIDPAG
jgi:threonine dehydrogenase-like Zn-dependent dehydrogenase